MPQPRQVYLLALAVFLTGTLPACAVYRKCGFTGCSGDANITASVQAQFRQHPALEPPNLLHVQTLDRVVYLTGQVDTELERSMAESLARNVAGVRRVVNSINFSYEGR
jgi:osmotically-inducible protein OsmY